MVLEESSNSGDIFTTDDIPLPDTNDSTGAATMRRFTADSTRTVSNASATTTPDEVRIAYRVNGGPLRQYQIRFDRMPLQGYARSVAFGGPRKTSVTAHSLIDLMTTVEAFTGRPVTQSEAEGVALHVSRKQLYNVAAAYGGIVAGALFAWTKRKTFKFPFLRPKSVERYDSFPLRRAPLLTGQYSRAAWHTVRGLSYVGVSWALMIPFWDYMGRNAQTVHLMRDDRTKNLTKEFATSLQRAHREIRGDMKRKIGMGMGSSPRSQGSNQSGSNDPDSDSSGSGEYYGGSQGGYVQDDNSSTAPQYPYSDSSSNTDVLTDAQTQSRIHSQRSSPSSPDPSNHNTFELEKVERQPRTFDSEYNPPNDSSSSSSPFFNEDENASPTARNEAYPTSPSSPSGSGSAWARVRQSATTSNPSPPPTSFPSPSPSSTSPDPTNKRGIIPPYMRRPQSASARQLQQRSARDEYETSGDSFSYSKEGEERQLAKEQAQREFDRMLEAERRGEEDAAGRGGGGGGGENYWGRRRGS